MFSWFRRKLFGDPIKLPGRAANPGIGPKARVAFSGGDKVQQVDVVQSIAGALKQHGHVVTTHETWLKHGDTGLLIRPQLVEAHALEKGGFQTVTTVEVSHPESVPEGIFEYQHATGDDVQDSLGKGFDQWAQLDFVVFLDSLREKPQHCTMMDMTFPAQGSGPPSRRRAILGPVAHFAMQPREAAGPECPPGQEEPHAVSCPCCLLTNTFDAFRSFIEGDGFYGIRLFALRDENGLPQSDCRVNGEDYERGASALRKYVEAWPQKGFEFRKQFVVVQSWHTAGDAG